ncbi:MAG: hypothetical protein R3F14_34270 [Polyangiaceae bacterium]
MDTKIKAKVDDLYTRKAAVIEQIMKLRHEQAQIKAEIVKVATEVGDYAIVAQQLRCW